MRRQTLKVESMVRRRRALSLAIGLSFVSAPAFAQTTLPKLPELPQLQSQVGQQLPVPYPFAETPSPRRAVSVKVVGLLGIGSSQPQMPVESVPAIPAFPPSVGGQGGQAKLPGTESMVVMAAASDIATSKALQFSQPEAAGAYAPNGLPNQPPRKGLPVYGSLSDPITDSLIDIEIPLEASTGRAGSAAPVPTVLVKEAALPALPDSAPEESKSRTPELYRPDQGGGLSLEKLQPRVGSPSKNQVVRSSRGDSGTVDSVASASGTGASSSSAPGAAELAFSLSDMHNAVSANKPFSLATSEVTPDMATTAVARESQPMRVQIEGEPSPAVLAPKQKPVASAKPQHPSIRSVPEFQVPTAMVETASQQGPAQRASLAVPLDRLATSATSLQPSKMKQGEPLRVGMQNATLLHTETGVAQVSVENPLVCQLLQTGEKSYSLIGLQPGNTRVALISTLANGEQSVEIREVSVAGPRAAAPSALDGLAQGIVTSLEQLYPQYAIDIDVVDRSLLVQGEVTSEAEAKRIIAFVRKASLTPVIDKLMSQEQ